MVWFAVALPNPIPRQDYRISFSTPAKETGTAGKMVRGIREKIRKTKENPNV
jgi:hypothetical protein